MTAETTSRTGSHPTLPAVIVVADAQARGGAGTPGPLTPLLGVSLLERAIFSVAEVGVSNIYVVAEGFDHAACALIEQFGRRAGVAVRAVPSASWKNGSGSGALAASAHVKGPFLLVVGNQVFDAEILQLLLDAHYQGGRECLVAVGGARHRPPEADGSSDGRTEPQVAARIGATALEAADTGLFLCRSSLFEALEIAARDGDGSLKGGVQRRALSKLTRGFGFRSTARRVFLRRKSSYWTGSPVRPETASFLDTSTGASRAGSLGCWRSPP